MGAKELLEEDDARELVGQGDRSEGDPVGGALEDGARQPDGTADREADVPPSGPPLLQQGSERLARELSPGAVKRAEADVRAGPLQDRLAFALRVRLGQLDRLEPRMAGDQPFVVGDVVREWSSNPTHADDD